MPLKQGSKAPVTKFPFQIQDKPALGTARFSRIVSGFPNVPFLRVALRGANCESQV